MFYYLHFAFGELRYWEINRFAWGYIANLQQSTNGDQVSQIVLLHWMYPSICQDTLKHQRSLVMWLFPLLKKKKNPFHASKKHRVGVNRNLSIYMKVEARFVARKMKIFQQQLPSAFNPNSQIHFHWQNLLHLENKLFTDKDSLIQS